MLRGVSNWIAIRVYKSQSLSPPPPPSLSLVCGDGECSLDIGETCDSCAVDCCPPALLAGEAVGISFGVIVFIGAFVVGSIITVVFAVSYG